MKPEFEMNGQIVLCKGVNDGEELECSIRELTEYLPNLESVSVVPVGLSKYRDGLYPLEPFDKAGCREKSSIMIEKWQKKSVWRSMGHILSMQVMSGICWQEEKFRKRNVMMVICSWRMVSVCCVFY